MSEALAIQDRKTADPDHNILTLFAERWSPRSFADRPVEPRKIRRMLEAARWTMSSYNEQPWHYVVASRHEDPETYEAVLGGLVAGNQAWAENAPVLMLSFYRTAFSENGDPNRSAKHDLGAASAALTFQATAMDLYVHQMAGIRKDVIRDTFDVPEDVEPMAGLAVGYLGDPDRLDDERRKAEQSPRSRTAITDFAFGAEWGTPAEIVVDE